MKRIQDNDGNRTRRGLLATSKRGLALVTSLLALSLITTTLAVTATTASAEVTVPTPTITEAKYNGSFVGVKWAFHSGHTKVEIYRDTRNGRGLQYLKTVNSGNVFNDYYGKPHYIYQALAHGRDGTLSSRSNFGVATGSNTYDTPASSRAKRGNPFTNFPTLEELDIASTAKAQNQEHLRRYKDMLQRQQADWQLIEDVKLSDLEDAAQEEAAKEPEQDDREEEEDDEEPWSSTVGPNTDPKGNEIPGHRSGGTNGKCDFRSGTTNLDATLRMFPAQCGVSWNDQKHKCDYSSSGWHCYAN